MLSIVFMLMLLAPLLSLSLAVMLAPCLLPPWAPQALLTCMSGKCLLH